VIRLQNLVTTNLFYIAEKREWKFVVWHYYLG